MNHLSSVAVGCAAIVVVGLAGCSTSKNTASSAGTERTADTASSTAGSQPQQSTASLTYDGKSVVTNAVAGCSMSSPNELYIGIPGDSGGHTVVLKGDPPAVETVALYVPGDGNVGFTADQRKPGETATATKDGNRYVVDGTVAAYSTGNLHQFHLEATCP